MRSSNRCKCRNLECKSHSKLVQDLYQQGSHIVPNGYYRRKSDRKKIMRFKCRVCGKGFSEATFDIAFSQKRRDLNCKIKRLLVSGVTMRRCAKLLNTTRTTVARKLTFLGEVAKKRHQNFFARMKKIEKVQFDEMMTVEYTKCKPVSLALAVSEDERYLLGVEVRPMRATGHLAKISREKYGFREDKRVDGLNALFLNIRPLVTKSPQFKSDECPFYRSIVEHHFPSANYIQYKGGRGAVAGQGELKKQQFDPIFSLNHTAAMLRANISRLIRKTWSVSKKLEPLASHIAIYLDYHNRTIMNSL